MINARVDVFVRAGRADDPAAVLAALGSGLHTAMCSWLDATLSDLAAGRPPY